MLDFFDEILFYFKRRANIIKIRKKCSLSNGLRNNLSGDIQQSQQQKKIKVLKSKGKLSSRLSLKSNEKQSLDNMTQYHHQTANQIRQSCQYMSIPLSCIPYLAYLSI